MFDPASYLPLVPMHYMGTVVVDTPHFLVPGVRALECLKFGLCPNNPAA